MAAAAAPNPDVVDFIASLEMEENKYSTVTTAAPNNINIEDTISDSSSITSNRDTQTADVWQDIATALSDWTQRILDEESRCNNKASSFRQTIEESLRRQQLDDFQDISELRYIANLWTNLLQAISCYTVFKY